MHNPRESRVRVYEPAVRRECSTPRRALLRCVGHCRRLRIRRPIRRAFNRFRCWTRGSRTAAPRLRRTSPSRDARRARPARSAVSVRGGKYDHRRGRRHGGVHRARPRSRDVSQRLHSCRARRGTDPRGRGNVQRCPPAARRSSPRRRAACERPRRSRRRPSPTAVSISSSSRPTRYELNVRLLLFFKCYGAMSFPRDNV